MKIPAVAVPPIGDLDTLRIVAPKPSYVYVPISPTMALRSSGSRGTTNWVI